MAITEAQKRATYKYRAKNKEKALYINKRSTTKNFILKLATSEDLADIRKYVDQRQAELDNQ